LHELELLGIYELEHKAEKILTKYYLPFVREHTLLQTGGWLRFVPRDNFKEDFLVCNCDDLINLDIHSLLEFHKENKATVTVVCSHVPDVSKFGSANIEGNKIKSFTPRNKERKKHKGWVNAGWYIFSPKVFDYVEPAKDELLARPYSLELDLFPKLAEEGKLFAYKTKSPFFPLNTMGEYKQAIQRWGK